MKDNRNLYRTIFASVVIRYILRRVKYVDVTTHFRRIFSRFFSSSVQRCDEQDSEEKCDVLLEAYGV